MKFDLSHFKKMKSDKNMTTLKHPQGHLIQINHKALSPKMKAQLDSLPEVKMSDGGEVPKPEPQPTQTPEPKNDAKADNAKKFVQSFKQATGYADGGDVEQSTDDSQALPVNVNQTPVIPEALANPNAGSNPITPSNAQEMIKEGSEPYGTASTLPVDTQPSPQDQKETTSSDQAPAVAPSTQSDSAMSPIMEGVNQQIKGIEAKAKAEGQLGLNEATQHENAANQYQQIFDQTNQKLNDINGEISNTLQDIKSGHIDPNHYLNSMGTGQKIATGIGLMLGGLGAGLTGQGNPALQFINDQIDRDIKGQVADLGRKQSLVSAYTQQMGNIRDGAMMARAVMTEHTAEAIAKQAALSKNPQAQANAQIAIGQLQQQIAPTKMLLAASQASQGTNGQQDPDKYMATLRVIKPEMAKEMESRYVPHVGFAQVPVPEDARKSLIGKQQLSAAAQDLYDWSKQHTGSLDPRQIAVGKQKAQLLQSLYREGVLGTVYKAGEQPLLDKTVGSDPTSFFNSLSNLPKLKEVIDSNARQMNIQKQAYGLPAAQNTQQGAPNVPGRDQQVKVVGGVTYRRGPNGEAIRVQ